MSERGSGGLGGMGPLSERAARAAFWAYALLLFTGTHWPALDLRVPGVDRPDLIVHFGAFSVWTALFWLSGYAGPMAAWRSVAAAGIVGVLYAAVDEGLQAIPGLRRTCAWDDYAANCGGVLIGCVSAAVGVWALRRARR